MWWKVHLYEKKGKNTSDPLNYIFKSRKYLPQHEDLTQFENDLLELIKSVKFNKVKNKFLDQLHKDISSIKKSKDIIYEPDKNTYNQLLTDIMFKTYKKWSIIYATRSIKKLKPLHIHMDFRK